MLSSGYANAARVGALDLRPSCSGVPFDPQDRANIILYSIIFVVVSYGFLRPRWLWRISEKTREQ